MRGNKHKTAKEIWMRNLSNFQISDATKEQLFKRYHRALIACYEKGYQHGYSKCYTKLNPANKTIRRAMRTKFIVDGKRME